VPVADWLLLAGALPSAYIACWLALGLLMLARHGRSRVTIAVGGPYILLVLICVAAGLVGATLTIAN
jgi:hypothetical protein